MPAELAERQQHRLVAAEADHLGGAAARRASRRDRCLHHLAERDAGDGRAHDEADDLGDAASDSVGARRWRTRRRAAASASAWASRALGLGGAPRQRLGLARRGVLDREGLVGVGAQPLDLGARLGDRRSASALRVVTFPSMIRPRFTASLRIARLS